MTEFLAKQFPLFSYPVERSFLGDVYVDMTLNATTRRGYILDADNTSLDGFYIDSTGSAGSNLYYILPNASSLNTTNSGDDYFFNRLVDTLQNLMTKANGDISDRFPNGGFNTEEAQITGTYDYSNGTGGFSLTRSGWSNSTDLDFFVGNSNIDNTGNLFGFGDNTKTWTLLTNTIVPQNPPIGCFHPNNINPVRTSNVSTNAYVAESIFNSNSYVSRYGDGVIKDVYNWDIMPAAYVSLNRASQTFFTDATTKPGGIGSKHNCLEFLARSCSSQNNNVQVYTGMTGSNENFRYEYKLRDAGFIKEMMDSGFIEDISGRGQLYNASIPLVGDYNISNYKF